jgi:hypothetical protein
MFFVIITTNVAKSSWLLASGSIAAMIADNSSSVGV